VAGLGIVYLIIASITKIWPWRKHYTVEVDSAGYRTGGCVRDDDGAFDSMEDCVKAVEDPNSVWFADRFWGYDEKSEECKRYPKLAVSVGDDVIIADYKTKEACQDAHKDKPDDVPTLTGV